jgi:hypothetical protein
MTAREQIGSLPSRMAERRITPGPTRGVAVALVGAVDLGLVGLASSFYYTKIALVEGIDDLRAEQVSYMYGWCLAAVWVFGIGFLIRAGCPTEPTGTVRSISMTRSQLMFASGQVAICCAALIIGAVLYFLAALPFIAITPPAAWIFMLFGTVVSGLVGSLSAEEFARKHFHK